MNVKDEEISHIVSLCSDHTYPEEKEQVSEKMTDHVSQELGSSRGCVTKSSQEDSSVKLQELPYVSSMFGSLNMNSDHDKQYALESHPDSFESDCLEQLDSNLLSSVVSSKVVPNSVSVQFGSAGYECEAVCESFSNHLQHKHSGLNISARSKSDQKLDQKNGDPCCRCLADIPLSCSIPEELNSSSPELNYSCLKSQHSTGSRRLKDHSFEQGLFWSHNQSLSQVNETNSWPRQQLFQKKNLGTSIYSNLCKYKHFQCSPRYSPHLTPQSSPDRSPQLKRTKNSVSHQGLLFPTVRGKDKPNPFLLSSYKVHVGSTFSIASQHSVSNPSSSLCDRPHISYSSGVDGQVFKDKTGVRMVNVSLYLNILLFLYKMLLNWFEEFSDQQRNVMLLKLLVSSLVP